MAWYEMLLHPSSNLIWACKSRVMGKNVISLYLIMWRYPYTTTCTVYDPALSYSESNNKLFSYYCAFEIQVEASNSSKQPCLVHKSTSAGRSPCLPSSSWTFFSWWAHEDYTYANWSQGSETACVMSFQQLNVHEFLCMIASLCTEPALSCSGAYEPMLLHVLVKPEALDSRAAVGILLVPSSVSVEAVKRPPLVLYIYNFK